MVKHRVSGIVSQEQVQQFHNDGFLIVRDLFTEDEMEQLKANFMAMHAEGAIPGCFSAVPLEQSGGDILKVYPRMMHPHRVNEMSMEYMLHPRVFGVLAELLGEEPIATQSMFYFKPPGAKGQALHQDNYYLKVEPGTCIAAWTAVDPADEDNGGIFVVPNSQRTDIQCPHEADPDVSFTTEEVVIPEGMQAIPTILNKGDVLFFNGNVIHGSYPNGTKDRFRRAFICHYAGISMKKISKYYFPLYTADGSIIDRDHNESQGPCGNEFAVAGPH